MTSIPILDLVQQYATIEAEVSDAVQKVLTSGGYIGGPLVQEFEQQLAAYVGVSECMACNSGTDALYLALRALEIGAGDEVITTTFSFFAAAEVISAVGAKPVFVDIDAQAFNLDIERVAAAITDRTKAIIPVHLFGQPVDMAALMAVARAHQLVVIEDCAQAIGAEWQGQKVGSFGQVGCFSFYPTKNLGACGDGGAVTTKDPVIAAKIRRLKDHGSQARYIHAEVGINSRLDALQATILQIKLQYLDTWNEQRQAVASRYQELLGHVPGIILPQELAGGRGVWHQYTIRVRPVARPSNRTGMSVRDWMRSQLQARGISSMVYYPLPLHLQPVYKDLGYQPGQLPVAEQTCQEVISLPIFPELSQQQQEQVSYGLKDCLTEGE